MKTNGSPRYPEFPKEEFERRWSRARDMMKTREIDALMVTEEINYSYFSGHYLNGLGSFYGKTRPLVFLLPLDDEPTLILNGFMRGDAFKRSWVRNIESWVEVPFTVSCVTKVLREQRLEESRIGVEFGLEQRIEMPYEEFQRLRSDVPKVEFVDAADIFWKVRMKKSNLEIEKIEMACKATSRAYDRCFQEIRGGMTEKEVGRTFARLMIEEGADRPGFVIVTSGPGESDRVSGGATDRKLSKGDTVWIDGGAVVDGYWSDFSREGTVGPSSKKQKECHELILDVNKACIDAVEPGVAVSDITRICSETLENAGRKSWGIGRIGHGLGMMITEQPSISLNDKTILEPEFVITIEPGLTIEEGMFCVEENILVTENGHRILTSASRELHEISSN